MNASEERGLAQDEIDSLVEQIKKEIKYRQKLRSEASKDCDEAIARLCHDREYLSIFEHHKKKEIDRKIEEFAAEYENFACRCDEWALFDIWENLSGVSYNPDSKTTITNSEEIRNAGIEKAHAILAETISKPEFKYEAIHSKNEPNYLVSLRNAIAIAIGALILILLFSCTSSSEPSPNEGSTTHESSSSKTNNKSDYARAAEEASHYYYDSAGHIHRDNR